MAMTHPAQKLGWACLFLVAYLVSAAAQDTPPVAAPVAQPQHDLAPPADIPNQIIVTTPAAARFDNAMTFYAAGQYVDAVTAFSDFVANFPQDRRREEALFRLAESYRNLKRTDDALAAYTYQVQNYPDGILRLNGELQRGAILFDQGKLAEAIAPLQFVVDKDSGERQSVAKYFLGRALLSTQKESEGRALLQSLADQQPPAKLSGDAAQTLAQLDDAQGDSTAALALWQKAVSLATDPAVKATAAARGGWSALTAKKTDAAEKLFTTARQLATDSETRKVANTGLLRILFQQKRYKEWRKIYDDAGNRTPSELLENAKAEILYDLGHANFVLKNWTEAVGAFDGYLASFGSEESAVTAAYERFLALAQIDKAKTVSAAEDYLRSYPKSPYRARVRLLEAQELSREKKFSDALSLWKSLADEPASESWPHQDILLELARAYDELGDNAKAASAYQNYLDDLTNHPNGDKAAQSRKLLAAQARLAVCLQNSNQLLAATDAWTAVQALAPNGSSEQETALEALGLIYAKGGPPQEASMAATFRKLLDRFPKSPLRALAAFTVGDSLFKNRDYAGAEKYLLNARDWDSKNWLQPATQRLALAAYGLKDYDKTVAYLKDYDSIVAPPDPQARTAAQLPAALPYWLAETARKAGKWSDAETYYARVTTHSDPGDLRAGAWWQLGEVQSQRKEWASAVSSYEKYRQLKPDAKDATTVILALGRAQLGAQNFDAAKKLGEQALLQEPEGPHSAASRMLLGETAFATKDYPGATRMFGTLALLFDDPKITPQAIARAADAYERAGDAKSTTEWRQKLKEKYPSFQPTPYL